MTKHIDEQLQDWKNVRELLFKLRETTPPAQKKAFWAYLEARNAYEKKYFEKWDKLKMPY